MNSGQPYQSTTWRLLPIQWLCQSWYNFTNLGLKIELTKTIRFLEKFGFEEEVISTGEYKDAFTSSKKLTKNDKS